MNITQMQTSHIFTQAVPDYKKSDLNAPDIHPQIQKLKNLKM